MPPIRSFAIAFLLLGCAAPPLPETATGGAASGPYPRLLPLSDVLAVTGTVSAPESTVADDMAARAAALRARADALH